MKLLRSALAIAAFGVLSACATSTPYAAAGSDDGYGFSEQRIEDDRFRITFKGNSLTDRETVETYLHYRAAEITLAYGYDHFIVVKDDTEKSTTYSGTRDRGFYSYYGVGRPFPYYGYGYRWDPFYDDVAIRERRRYSAIAYFVLGKGEKPADEPAAYDARQVIENLRPSIILPGQG